MKKVLFFLPLFFCFFDVKAGNTIYFESTNIDVMVGANINEYLPKAYYFKDGEKCSDDIIYDYGIDGTPLSIVNTNIIDTYRLICKASNTERKISIKTSIYFNVIDTISPVLYDCDEKHFEYGIEEDIISKISWTDNYYTNIDISIIGEIDFFQVGKYNVIYKAVDGSNNSCYKQGVVYIDDVVKPYMVYEDLYINANREYDLLAGIKIYDDTDDNVKIRVSEDNIDITEKGMYYAEYVISDKSQNISIYRRNVFVGDFESPKITLKKKKITKKPDEIIDYRENILEVSDNFSDLFIEHVKIDLNEKKQGTFFVTYYVFDGDGNYGESKCEVSSIDDINPVIYGENKTIIDPKSIMDGISAYDNIEGDISNRIYIIDNNVEEKPGNYFVTFEVYDLSGNYAKKTIFYEIEKRDSITNIVFPNVQSANETENIATTKVVKKKKNYLPYFIGGGIAIVGLTKIIYCRIKKRKE